MAWWRALIACVALGAAACSGVKWENHSPGLQSRIDRLANQRDCDGLQEQFDIADANDDAQRRRTGTGNADLMGYIDDKLDEADCYG